MVMLIAYPRPGAEAGPSSTTWLTVLRTAAGQLLIRG
jgi:hypothetical protein